MLFLRSQVLDRKSMQVAYKQPGCRIKVVYVISLVMLWSRPPVRLQHLHGTAHVSLQGAKTCISVYNILLHSIIMLDWWYNLGQLDCAIHRCIWDLKPFRAHNIQIFSTCCKFLLHIEICIEDRKYWYQEDFYSHVRVVKSWVQDAQVFSRSSASNHCYQLYGERVALELGFRREDIVLSQRSTRNNNNSQPGRNPECFIYLLSCVFMRQERKNSLRLQNEIM